jgi:hypothetical protein
MNTFSKTAVFFAILSFITPIYAMNENNQLITVDASLSISNICSVMYKGKNYHDLLAKDHNITSTTSKDPIIPVLISPKDSMYSYITLLPAKIFEFCTNNSSIQLLDNTGVHPVLINATCKKNELLAGKNFKKQYKNEMKKFFSQLIFNETDKEELEEAGIITKEETIISSQMFNPIIGQMIWVHFPHTKWLHGPNNGGSSKKQIVQSILHENVPHNANTYSALAQRECTGCFKGLKARRKFITNNDDLEKILFNIALEKNNEQM